MNDPRLDRDTAERMLRGERTGPEEVAELLAAVSSNLPAEASSDAEEAAVTAFRAARARRPEQPSRRRPPALAGLKAVLIGVVLLLVGGVAMAATTQHLPNPLEHKRPHSTRTPATSNTYRTHVSPGRSSRPAPYRPTPSAHPSGSRPTPHQKAKAHHTKKPKGKASKTAPHEDVRRQPQGSLPPQSAGRGPDGRGGHSAAGLP